MASRFVRLEVRGGLVSATAGRGGEVKQFGDFPNELDSMRRLISALGQPSVVKNIPSPGELSYVLYWQL
jgi:hypothetical protein